MARRLRALSKQYECLFSCPGAKLATAGRALVSIHGKSVGVRKRGRDFTKMPGNLLGEQNVIVGSDVCFWDSLVDPLVKMTWRALKNGTKRVVIADPGRPTFYEFCDKVGAKSRVSLQEWYCIEPDRHIGEVVEVRPR